LAPAESGLLIQMAVVAIVVGAVAAWWPKLIAWPAAVIAAWIGLTWLGKAWSIRRVTEAPGHVAPGRESEVAQDAAPPDAATRDGAPEVLAKTLPDPARQRADLL
jgi:hypothetical protein